jgi:hypothetical protein
VIRRLEQHPGWNRAAQSPAGQVVLGALCGLLLTPSLGSLAFPVTLALLAVNSVPRRRRLALTWLAIAMCAISLGAIHIGLGASAASGRLGIALTAAVGIAVAALWVWSRYLAVLPAFVVRHPLALCHASAVLGVAALWALRRFGVLDLRAAAMFAALIPELLWRASYWIKWRVRQDDSKRATENLFTLIPFLGRGGVPYGKGPEYLSRFESTDAKQLASARLRGTGLLVLSVAWNILSSLLQARLHGEPASWLKGIADFPISPVELPLLPTMAALCRDPGFFSMGERWAALFAELLETILKLAAYGHAMVGIYCFAGFSIPRNTRSPLFASTLLDFWARYYFYFKELLMDFFFFPVYLRCARMPALPRALVATVAAAFAGNLYYHLFLYAPELMRDGSGRFVPMALERVVYCGFLATGLGFSFARSLRPRAKAVTGWSRVVGTLWAALFFALLHIWNYQDVDISLKQRAELARQLFNLAN